jgi:cell division septation protein DedD
MYTFRLHLWGVVLVALGAILVGVLLAVGGCLVGEWRVERAAVEGGEVTADPSGASTETSSVGAGAAEGAPDEAPRSAPDSGGAPVTYTVRLGSFGGQEEAQAFADGVTARGYAAAVVPDETRRGTTFFHVTVGSYATRWEARGAAREIEEREERRGWRATVMAAPAPP